jgi:hypothetical protein
MAGRLTLAVLGFAAALMTGGCASGLYSSQPLFTQGKDQLKPGLWALMEPDCATVPASASIPDWPNCAMPVWVYKQRVTFIMPPVNHFPLVVSDGDPKILQFALSEASFYEKAKKRDYIYWLFAPEGASPYVRGVVRPIRCPDPAKPIAGISQQDTGAVADVGVCVTASAEAVRTAAKAPPPADKKGDDRAGRAVWITD